VGSSSKLIKSSDDAPDCSVLPYVGANSMIACTDWLFSGILERHPGIRVVFSEGGAGWVPYFLEQAEHTFHGYRVQLAATRPPREMFAAHVYVSFLRDDAALRALDVIPVDNVTWESDYPHDSGLFPDSRASLEASVRDLPEPVAVKIAETNARRLFRL
jgi:predicted TIM-barrel fold metal-dependent hydrolase